MSAIYILWLREVKKYLRSRSRIVGSLGQPLLFLLAFGFGFGSIYSKASGGASYINFLAPGIILMSVLFTGVFSGISLIWDRQFGFLKETMVAPVSRLQIMLGKTLGGATVAALQGLIVFILTLFVGFRPQNWAILPLAAVFVFVVAVLFTSLGVAIASNLEDMQGFQLIMNFLVMPIFFLSGALFPLANLPTVMEAIVKIDPLAYGVDAMRETLLKPDLLIKSSYFNLPLDLVVLVALAALLLFIGSFMFERIEV